MPGGCDIYTFSNYTEQLPPRQGIALVDAIRNSNHGGTYLSEAVKHVNQQGEYDRLIVIADEQSASRKLVSATSKGYMINVASNKNGVGYGSWTHIDGFSERVIDYVQAIEHS